MYEPTLERVGGSLLVRCGYPRCATLTRPLPLTLTLPLPLPLTRCADDSACLQGMTAEAEAQREADGPLVV